MAKAHTILEVFIASPSDVLPERQILESVINEFNLTWGNNHKVRLEILKWETHSRPAVGSSAQDVINQQIGDNYDIFLGIMWGRFGSPTSRAESGTEEEFQRAFKRHTNRECVEIMFYFKDAGIPPSKLDGAQVDKVNSFKAQLASEYGALYHEFESTDDFQQKTRIHLSQVVQDWLRNNSGGIESKTTSVIEVPKAEAHNPLANLSALSVDDADEGVMELVDRGTDAMQEVGEIVVRMSAATNRLGERFLQRTNEANEITKKRRDGSKEGADRSAAQHILNKTASDIDFFVKQMSVEIPEFYKFSTIFAESFSKIAMIAEKNISDGAEDVQATLQSMHKYRRSIQDNLSQLTEFRDMLSQLPTLTTRLGHSRRRAVAIMDDLLTQLRIAAGQIGDIEELLGRLLKAGDSAA